VELHDSIEPAIPQFFELLKNQHPDVRSEARLALTKLVHHGESWLDIIAALLIRG
jgi:hypothetical protein